MGLKAAGLACAGLWMAFVAAAQDAAPLKVPPPIGELLAAVTGVPNAGMLQVTGMAGPGGVGSGLSRIETEDGGPLLTIAASGGRMEGGSFLADRVEIWRDAPLLSVDGVRIEADGAGISAAADGILFTGSFGQLGLGVSVGRTSFAFNTEHAELSVELDSPTGRVSPAGRPDGILAWTARRAVFGESPDDGRPRHLRMEAVALELGASRTAGAQVLEIEADSGGAWHIRAEGLTVSAGLADRFRPISGLVPPPVSMEMTILPEGPSGRRSFSSAVSEGTAALRIEGWLGGQGTGDVTRVDADGLLRFLADAGSADPLVSAAAMGLHYDQAGQDADLTSWPDQQ